MKKRVWKRILCYASACCLGAGFAAATGVPTAAYAEELPSAAAEARLVTMTFYGDTETQMAFHWNTDEPTGSDVQVTRKGKSFAEGKVFSGVTSASTVQGDGYLHACVATGLSADTAYAYRVGDAEQNVWTETGSFTTAGASDAYSFLHVSDPQGWTAAHYDRYDDLLRDALGRYDVSFICNTGDIVNNSWKGSAPKLEQWEWAITDRFDILKDTVMMPVAGNHDAADDDFASRFTLATPENADTRTGSYYSFDYNGAHFLCLNTNDSDSAEATATGLGAEQLSWVERDLAANRDADWLFVMMHKGIYDCGAHSNNTDGSDYDIALMRAQLAPLFTEYGVDLVMQGHDHLYSRTYPLIGAADGSITAAKADDCAYRQAERNGITYSLAENAGGPVYLNSGTASGSKFYDVKNADKSVFAATDGAQTQMYTAITVDGDRLYADVYRFGNGTSELYDTFGLWKTSSAPTGGGIGGGAIAGIVIGAVAVVAGAAVGVFFLVKRRKGRAED